MERSKSHHLVKRMITPITVWAVSKILGTPRVKAALQKADDQAYRTKKKAARSVKRAGRNALQNGAWLAAGTAAVVLGAGLIGKSTRKA